MASSACAGIVTASRLASSIIMPEGSIQLEASIKRVRRGHELRLIIAGDSMPAAPLPQRDERLVGLVAESLQARALMLGSPERSINDVAASQQRCRKRLGQLVRLSFLAPDIVQIILRGEQPSTLTYARLLETELPSSWHEQRVTFELA